MGEDLQLETTIAKRATTSSAGKLGKGTPGSRTKSKWRAVGSNESLKTWARRHAKQAGEEVTGLDAKEWLSSKRPGGSDAQRKVRKDARAKRQAMKWSSAATPTAPSKEKKSSSGRGSGR